MSGRNDQGHSCPVNLGEYRDLWAQLSGEDSSAVAFLDRKIAEQGRDAEVIAADSQMILLFAHLLGSDVVPS